MNEVQQHEHLHHHKNIDENKDILEIGTPAKGGAIKIYGDFNDKETFKQKIDRAKEVREYAQKELGITNG